MAEVNHNRHDTERQNGSRWERNVRSLLVVLYSSPGIFTTAQQVSVAGVTLPLLNVLP